MKKGTIRLIVSGAIIAGIFITSFVLFGASKGLKAQYDANKVEISSATLAGDDAEVARLEAINKGISSSYAGLSGSAYGLTIAGLAAFGISLAVNDKIREKEDEAAARG